MVSPKKFQEESQKLNDMKVSMLPNQDIFFEGDKSREMYILISGKVEIIKNNKRIAIVEGEGNYLGELSTLLGVPRTATIRTMSECEFIVVSGDRVNDFFHCSPMLGLKLAKILADRLVKMNIGYVKLEHRTDALSSKLREANDKIKMRDRQIRQLIERIERIEQLRQ